MKVSVSIMACASKGVDVEVPDETESGAPMVSAVYDAISNLDDDDEAIHFAVHYGNNFDLGDPYIAVYDETQAKLLGSESAWDQLLAHQERWAASEWAIEEGGTLTGIHHTKYPTSNNATHSTSTGAITITGDVTPEALAKLYRRVLERAAK